LLVSLADLHENPEIFLLGILLAALLAQAPAFCAIARMDVAKVAVAELALDDSSDDNRDDSGSLKHHGYGPKTSRSCLVTVAARSWQCGGHGFGVPLAPLWTAESLAARRRHCLARLDE
jgi:hypothetical protein